MRYSTGSRTTVASLRTGSVAAAHGCPFANRPPAVTGGTSSTSTTMIASDGSMPFTRWTEGLELSVRQTLPRTVRGPEPLAGTTGRW